MDYKLVTHTNLDTHLCIHRIAVRFSELLPMGSSSNSPTSFRKSLSSRIEGLISRSGIKTLACSAVIRQAEHFRTSMKASPSCRMSGIGEHCTRIRNRACRSSSWRRGVSDSQEVCLLGLLILRL